MELSTNTITADRRIGIHSDVRNTMCTSGALPNLGREPVDLDGKS
jgi:hypothetical protein